MKKTFTFFAVVLLSLTMVYAQQARRTPASKMVGSRSVQRVLTAPAEMKSGAKTVITSFPYNEGFESGTADWTLIDNDNDGLGWTVVSSPSYNVHGGSSCISSASWTENTEALTPDNWLISSQMQIPAGSNLALTWYDAAQDPAYPADSYSVYIATSNTVAAFTATTAVFSTTLSTDTWTMRSVDLSAYAGQNIYVAFRHHNCSDQYVMLIDDISVGVPGAPELTLNGPTTIIENTQATFTATCSDANATINWTLQGATPATATGTSVTATWATAGTYTVQASVQNSNGTATQSLTLNVVSCDAITTLPWMDDFESESPCWQIVDNDNDGTTWNIGVENTAHSGTGSLFCSYASTQSDDWAISPAITIPADASDINLSWYVAVRSTYFPETYAVYVSTNGTALTSFDSVYGEVCSEGVFVKRSVSLASYAGQTINVAFRYRSTDMYYIYIDDVRIGGAELPAEVAISGPVEIVAGETATYTASTITSDVTFNWTAEGGTPATGTGATFAVSFANAGTYDIVLAATNTVGTVYDTFSVVAIECGTVSEVPWTTDFRNAHSLQCWTPIDANNDGLTWSLYEGVGAVDYSFHPELETAVTPDDYLVSPAITLPATGNYELSFSIAAGNQQYFAEHYSVYVSTGNTVSDFTTELFSETLGQNVYEHSLSLNAFRGQTIYVAFRHHDCSDQLAIALRSVEIRTMSAPTVTLQAPASAIVGNSVTLSAVGENIESYSWTIEGATPSTATTQSVDVVWNAAGTYTISLTATNAVGTSDASATINVVSCDPISQFPYAVDFEAGSTYDCFTFIDADGDGNGWNTDNYFTSPQGHNGSTGVLNSASYINNVGALTPDNWMFLPAIVVPADGQLNVSWWDKGQDTGYCAEHYAVYVSAQPNTAVASATEPKFEGESKKTWSQRAFSLSEFAGQTVYIGFRHYNVTDMFMLDIDDILVSTEAVGIAEAEQDAVSVYPNPTTGMLYVDGEGIVSVEVLDINGRVMMTSTANRVDISGLSNGIYMVRTVTNNGVSLKKVVKK